MNDTSNLDKWVEYSKPTKTFENSLFSHERVTLFSLKERIIELERMRDQILYELDRLKSLSETRFKEG